MLNLFIMEVTEFKLTQILSSTSILLRIRQRTQIAISSEFFNLVNFQIPREDGTIINLIMIQNEGDLLSHTVYSVHLYEVLD